MPELWCLGARLRKRLFLYEGFLEAALICIAVWVNLPSTMSQAQAGFLSIDCGYTGASYNDSNGLTWVADETFIMTGNTSEQIVNSSDLANFKFESGTILQTYRYFPESRSKYCYNLATTLSVPYLLRATFFLNGFLFNQRQPFQFNIFINANNWFTITSGEDSPSEFSVIEEAIFYPQRNITYICLQPMVGVPFISSLELRPLRAKMYSYYGSQRQYLVLLGRWNLGSNSTVRFPDDNFDRIWYDSSVLFLAIPTLAISTPPDNTSRANVYYVPPKVMQDGWLMSDIGPSGFDLSQSYESYTTEQMYMTPEAYAFAVLYTEYLNISDSQTYSVDVYLDDDVASPLSFSHNASMQTHPNLILSSSTLFVGLNMDVNLTMGPTLNAFEVYGQVNYNFSQTDPHDVHAIEALKTSLSLTDWQGDPCSPVPHDWLSCTPTSWFQSPMDPIQEPCGSNRTSLKECTVQQGYLISTYFVTALNFSHLATNDLTLFTNASGKSSPIYLQELGEMSLTNSGIDSQKFLLLIENFLSYVNLSIGGLDLSYNSVNSMPEASVWGALGLLQLNLSHNALNDTTLLSFQYLPDYGLTYLSTVDLSYNVMSLLPSTWINTSYVLTWLDLSHNLLQGQISNLDELIGINNATLQALNVSHNNLTEKFSSSLYFTSLPSLTIANFDHNLIGGTLDLSAWYNVLQNTSKNASLFLDTLPLFSFVNNSISDIFPSADTFEDVMLMLMENQTFHQKGILLGGNPYCKGAKAYIQRYFCRFSVDEIVPRVYPNDNHNKIILIISICSGVGAFILLFAIVATLWKLWKQVYELREIQQALANRKVQPPFYQYNDLKFATREFHNDNKLGQGGFGVVYKGIFADNTTLAVKKLFNSQRLQELDEFLNEVVLLTGIKHKNLVQLKGCCIKDKQRMLIYEYVENGNLAEALWGSLSKVHGALNWEQRFNICVGVARGLSYLHEELHPCIIHRDIKPENVLLDRNFRPKIADFGLARQFEESNQARYTQVAGTLGYFSPEYASEGQLSSKADVYSFGILVLEVVSGRKCIDLSLSLEEKFLKDWVRRMHKKGLVFDTLQPKLRDNCDEAQVMRAINVGLLCVQHDPERRPSMSTVVTMFLGRADVEVFLDESDTVHSDLNTLLLTIDDEFENPTLESIVEVDSPNFYLIDRNSESSSSFPPTHRRSSRPLVELCTIRGR